MYVCRTLTLEGVAYFQLMYTVISLNTPSILTYKSTKVADNDLTN